MRTSRTLRPSQASRTAMSPSIVTIASHDAPAQEIASRQRRVKVFLEFRKRSRARFRSRRKIRHRRLRDFRIRRIEQTLAREVGDEPRGFMIVEFEQRRKE